MIDALDFLDLQRKFMAIFHAYFDESGKKGDNAVVTFCGVCAPRSKLRAFEEDWEGLLRHHGLQNEGFHMVKALRYSRPYGTRIPAQNAEQRQEALKPFADSINEHLELGLIQAWDVKGFKEWTTIENAQKLGSPDDPYYPAFALGILELFNYVSADDHIALICDEDQETALKAHLHYIALRKARPDIGEKTVALTFANDQHFPALQAADFASWLARREAQLQFHKRPYQYQELYRYLVTTHDRTRRMEWRYMYADEDMQVGLKKDLEKRDVNESGIRAFRQDNGPITRSLTLGNKSQTGRGESGKG